VTISRLHSGMRSGMYVFLISAVVALVASSLTQSSSFLVPRATEDIEGDRVMGPPYPG